MVAAAPERRTGPPAEGAARRSCPSADGGGVAALGWATGKAVGGGPAVSLGSRSIRPVRRQLQLIIYINVDHPNLCLLSLIQKPES